MIKENNIHCTGCAACLNICPVGAISLRENFEGFLYPMIDRNMCIRCSKCDMVCQLNTTIHFNDESASSYYAVVNLNEQNLMKSSSGGAFLALANYVFSLHGVVLGCIFNQNLVAEHTVAESFLECEKMCGSKYVQSNISFIYNKAKAYLDSGRVVLFTGTPCQVEGLKLFLGKEYEKLITVDLICHGVPSPLLWKKHKSWIEDKNRKKLREYRFRGKLKVGWSLYYYYYFYGSNKCYSGISNLDPYYQDFLKCKNYRESCYSCKFARPERVSDFTIGDYWGGEQLHRDLNKDTGISLLIANTSNAKKIIKHLYNYLNIRDTDRFFVLENNKQLTRPVVRPECRDTYYIKVLNNINKWENDFKSSREWRIVKIKSMIPISIKKIIKKVLKRV